MPWLGGVRFGLAAQADEALLQLTKNYSSMPLDPHLFSEEGARFRRYARFLIDPKSKSLKLFQHDRFFQADRDQEPYEISLHMIRIQAHPNNDRGRPAPEGIHRDGYHFGSIHLMNRENVLGAENNVYDLSKNLIDQQTLNQPMDSIYFDDRKIFHSVNPFTQQDREAAMICQYG